MSKPTYKVMVAEAIKSLKVRAGASRPAIKGYIAGTYGDPNAPALRKAIKDGVEEGFYVQEGQRFKLTDEGRALLKLRKITAPKKPTKKKSATKKKTASKKKAPTKKKKAASKKKTTTKKKKTTTKKKKTTTKKKKTTKKK